MNQAVNLFTVMLYVYVIVYLEGKMEVKKFIQTFLRQAVQNYNSCLCSLIFIYCSLAFLWFAHYVLLSCFACFMHFLSTMVTLFLANPSGCKPVSLVSTCLEIIH